MKRMPIFLIAALLPSRPIGMPLSFKQHDKFEAGERASLVNVEDIRTAGSLNVCNVEGEH